MTTSPISTFTWLDYAEQDRQSMLDVLDAIDLLRERDTRDELGIGTIRDGLAELLFPGVNTIQSRARYFLFIPWVYLELEHQRVPSNQIARRARDAEVALIEPLKKTGEDGVFGRDAGSRLQRLPSSVYWYGLRRWEIRLFAGAQGEYHRSLDSYYRDLQRRTERDEGELMSRNWHAALPAPPPGFPGTATFNLTRGEAEYLCERVMAAARSSLLAFLLDQLSGPVKLDFVWQHPQLVDMPRNLQQEITHARDFSECMHGAALLYNLMLAEAQKNVELVDRYRSRINMWGAALDQQPPKLLTTGRVSFWTTVLTANPHVPARAQSFVDAWLDAVSSKSTAAEVVEDKALRAMITERERWLKGPQARLQNDRALELWSGAAGVGQLDYRWPNVQTILNDIDKGLQGGRPNA